MAASSRGTQIGGSWTVGAYLCLGLLLMGSLLTTASAESAAPEIAPTTPTSVTSSPSSSSATTASTTPPAKDISKVKEEATTLTLGSKTGPAADQPSTSPNSDSTTTSPPELTGSRSDSTGAADSGLTTRQDHGESFHPGSRAGSDPGQNAAFAQSGGAPPAGVTLPPPGVASAAENQTGGFPVPNNATINATTPVNATQPATPAGTTNTTGTGGPTKPGTTGQPGNNAGFPPNSLGKNNGTTGNAESWEGRMNMNESDSNVRLQDQIYILSGVFGFVGLIQFIISVSLAVSVSSLHAKLRKITDSMKPTSGFGTLNRGYLRNEMEMGDFGGGLDELSTRYDQHAPNPAGHMSGSAMGLQGLDFNGYGSPPSAPKAAGIAVNRPPGFPRPHWVGERGARNYS